MLEETMGLLVSDSANNLLPLTVLCVIMETATPKIVIDILISILSCLGYAKR